MAFNLKSSEKFLESDTLFECRLENICNMLYEDNKHRHIKRSKGINCLQSAIVLLDV